MPRQDDYLDLRLSLRPNGGLRLRATAHLNGVPVALGTRDIKTDEVFQKLVLPTYRKIASSMRWRIELTVPKGWPTIRSTV